MNKTRIILVVSLVVVILICTVAGFFLLRNSSNSRVNQTKQSSSNQPGNSNQGQPEGISLDEVAKHTGKDGNSCWVAVDGTAYEISGFVLWLEGDHKPSGGRAKCGKDLSEVIKQSPHGKSKLKLLKEIGPLQQ